MQPAIELVIFDLAGTTVADKGSIAEAFAHAMLAHGVVVPLQAIEPLMGYKKPEAIAIMLNRFAPADLAITDKLIEDIHTRFEQNMIAFYQDAANVKPLPYAEEVFAMLNKAGIKVAADTGFSSRIAQVILDQLGWLDNGLMQAAIASNQVPAGRPHPFMIQSLMQKLGVHNPKAVVKVGDTEVDVNEGRNAGCLYSIAVTTGAFSRAEIAPYQPDYILDSLSELLPILGLPGLEN
ncbi:MAG TPA: HAD hydrolase-like protein [Phnomibacter sp.]|nr:HAD hydrolase-like protein [Phnomibacter sp.]